MKEKTPTRALKTPEFMITSCDNASQILEFAEKNGLNDVKKWITVEGLQQSLIDGRLVAFIAVYKLKNGLLENYNLSELAGVCIGGYEEEGRMWIELLAVGVPYRRKGLGTALVGTLIKEAQKNSLRALFVDVDDDNYSAQTFFIALGFEDAGRIKAYYYDKTDAIIFLYNL